MSRTTFPFSAPDMSALARSLRGQLQACDHMPGHVELLNMLARATGHRNYQHFRAQAAAQDRMTQALESAPAPAEPVDHQRVERVARLFDADGRLTRYPGRQSQQLLCLWVLWSRIPAGAEFNERQVNEMLNANHLFGDHALLRRALCSWGLMWRTVDGRVYRRIERRPPADALTLIEHLKARSG